MDARQWFREAKFGLMIHWGLYCLPAGEWKGRRTPHIGEWLQAYFRIPNAEYHRLAEAFNPILFNADEFAALAADAGMKYLVITAKHHEGFALFRSRVSDFSAPDGTPFRRDILEELAAACQKRGIRLGLYYSQALDWSHPHGGGVAWGHTWEGVGGSWTNDWDFPDNAHKNYTICYEEKIKPQVREILTQYGDLCVIWFDTPCDISPEQSRELVDMVHKYQPDCLVNSRVGNGLGDYASLGDNEIPADLGFSRREDPHGEHGTAQFSLYESACTLNNTWGYKSFDNNWKDAGKVLEIRDHLNSLGINYLLNVGPDGLGRIPGPAVEILKEAGRRG